MIHITVDCEQLNVNELHGRHCNLDLDTSFSKRGNNKLLRLFKNQNVAATFFATGFFASKEKKHIAMIHSMGHEIAGHSYCHFYRKNTTFDLLNDITQCKSSLSECTNEDIMGFRAPQMQYSLELIKHLDSLGFKYDSSLHPAFMPGFYLNNNMPIIPFRPIKHLGIMELPVCVDRFRLPVSWIFIRFFGIRHTVNAIRYYLSMGIEPIIYVHSWEFCDTTKLDIPFQYKFNTGDKFLSQLQEIIKSFKGIEFNSMKDHSSLKKMSNL